MSESPYNERCVGARWIIGSAFGMIGVIFALLAWPFLELADRILPTSKRSVR